MGSFLVAAHTLGCKVNQCDTEAITRLLSGIGCSVVDFDHIADMYIINTCTVTHASDRKSRQMVRRAKKLNPCAKIAVCGCMTKSSPIVVRDLGVDFIFDARQPQGFIEYVQGLFQAGEVSESILPSRTRGFVKIQDGCDRFCTYCIVPYVRGAPKSRPLSEIVDEVSHLVNNGVKEIVLTGIQIGAYGEDTKSFTLPQLITILSSVEGLKRLRISSIEPNAVTDEFIAACASAPMLCDHFHISLQSGCDTTLQRMNRHYTTKQYEEILAKVRRAIPNVAITTDIIVGFPGETADDFLDTVEFVRAMKFANVHIFEYSKRDGTPAAEYPDQVSDKAKSRRSDHMQGVVRHLRDSFNSRQAGKLVSVLFESEKKPGVWRGYSTNYCQVDVEIPHIEDIQNEILQVEIVKHNQIGLNGVL